MAEIEGRKLTPEEITAKIAEAARKKAEADLRRDTKHRRAAEVKQRQRINTKLLRANAGPQREPWTFRASKELVKEIERLAEELSEPGAKVSVAALMEEAMNLVLAKYREEADKDA